MATKLIVGNIPENVTYIYSDPKTLSCFWEDDALHGGWEGQEVIPAFCSDSSNAKTMETGKRWAEGGYWAQKKSAVQETHRKNDPIKGIKIVSLEARGNGGRAYKVVTPDNFFFDVREDVLMDTMLEAGMDKGGILGGEFVWAKVRSEMKLVRVGSALHKALIGATADRSLKKIGYGDLQVGHVYVGKGAKKYVFLGYVDTTRCVAEPDNSVGWGVRRTYTYHRSEIKNALLLWEQTEFTGEVCEKNIYQAEVRPSHSFIKDVGTVDLPANIIQKVSKWKTNRYENGVKEDAARYKRDTDYSFDSFPYYSDGILMRPTGTVYAFPEKYVKHILKFQERVK